MLLLLSLLPVLAVMHSCCYLPQAYSSPYRASDLLRISYPYKRRGVPFLRFSNELFYDSVPTLTLCKSAKVK